MLSAVGQYLIWFLYFAQFALIVTSERPHHMPGFLSAYEGTQRIDLGRGYWIDVKKCLSSAEYAPVEFALGSRQHVSANGNGKVQFSDIDQREAQIRMLIASIDDWNLDDDGVKWPLADAKAKRASIERLPVAIRMQVYKVCDALNGPPEEDEQARFPDGAERGDPDGIAGPGSAVGLPDGTGVLAAAGADEGSAEEPSAA